ncbi:MAG TPA: hypothetical protein ENH62_03560 [Marinobacter sp.]|uniref:Uncharacterized protein n=1 Tax=marine sediment metagenome TaxID=412755 RepID=A0A0F9QVZ2_9ZZZZ|nr:hypothetical protein [Marinobacter sp.]
MTTTQNTGAGPVVATAQSITIERAVNGFMVSRDMPAGSAIIRHVFEDYLSLFDHLNKEFGENTPYEKPRKQV